MHIKSIVRRNSYYCKKKPLFLVNVPRRFDLYDVEIDEISRGVDKIRIYKLIIVTERVKITHSLCGFIKKNISSAVDETRRT